MSGQKNLHDKLEAAKGKAALREFDVTITETLRMTVSVTAKNRDDAEQIVSDNWHNSDYILDADHFVGVEFEAASVKREHSRETGR
jgi:hypothetical protein